MLKVLIGCFIVIILIILIILIFGLIITHTKDDLDTFDVDYIIVLGHKLINNKPNEVLINRLNKTVEYVKLNNKVKIILSGGVTEDNTVSEAEVMKQYLIDKGIQKNSIILENDSKDTIENFYNCKKIVDDSKVLVISSRYHLFRARMICKLLNINVVAIGSKVSIIDSIKHAFIEAIFVFIHYKRIINDSKEQNV